MNFYSFENMGFNLINSDNKILVKFNKDEDKICYINSIRFDINNIAVYMQLTGRLDFLIKIVSGNIKLLDFLVLVNGKKIKLPDLFIEDYCYFIKDDDYSILASLLDKYYHYRWTAMVGRKCLFPKSNNNSIIIESDNEFYQKCIKYKDANFEQLEMLSYIERASLIKHESIKDFLLELFKLELSISRILYSLYLNSKKNEINCKNQYQYKITLKHEN